jgi:D-alanine--poly(phosphoribitol) ligase subunit 2
MTKADDIERSICDIVKGITFTMVERDQPLISTNLLDSIGVVDFIVEIEHKFGVSIDLQQVNPRDFDTVEQIARQVSERLTI